MLNYGLGYLDAKRIRDTIPGITIVLPALKIREYVWNISRRVDCEVVATVPWYPEMRNHRVTEGRFFTDEETEAGASVCVLGSEMIPLLFPLETPLGKHVRIGANYYRVVGVMEPQGVVPGNGESQDGSQPTSQRMFIPLETAKVRYGEILTCSSVCPVGDWLGGVCDPKSVPVVVFLTIAALNLQWQVDWQSNLRSMSRNAIEYPHWVSRAD